MEEIKMPKNLGKGLVFSDEDCDQHNRPTKKMVVNGSVVCPICELEKDNKRLEAELQEHFDNVGKREQYNTLKNKSFVEDQTILEARLSNYETKDREETENKKTAVECIERYKQGQVFNIILQGLKGSGKSHLSYSILHELNETNQFSCLFIGVESMLRKIKASFNNKESKYTEDYFVDLLSKVDFLVLDDLGAETGAINTDKTATDFVQRILYAVTTVRQNKATIITTNLSSKSLFNIYDEKVVSRLFRKPKFIIFKETKDKRTSEIPF